jgi:hypothetical protein
VHIFNSQNKRFLTTEQGKLDDELEELIMQLDQLYPKGRCPDHPSKQCYVYVPSNLHFDLGDRARKIVWAASIVSIGRAR